MGERITFTLGKTLKELDITKNALAVEAKIRPATVGDLVEGRSKAINFDTLEVILNTINRIGNERGIKKHYSIEDVFKYKEETDSK